MTTQKILAERRAHRAIRSIMLVFTAGGLAACGLDRPTVPNYNNPTPTGLAADPVGGVQLSANGLIFQLRGQMAGWISGSGIMGRESFNYTPTEGRNTTCWLQKQDYACGGGASFWAGFWRTRRTTKSKRCVFTSGYADDRACVNASPIRDEKIDAGGLADMIPTLP